MQVARCKPVRGGAPEAITNVQSMGIVDVTMPQNLYVFSRVAQNTKMWVELNASLHELEIQEGTYTGNELALELACRLRGLGLPDAGVLYDKVGLRFWFKLGANVGTVIFRFDIPNDYVAPAAAPADPALQLPQPPRCAPACWGNTVERAGSGWHRCTKWGLGWYLGFSKKEAVAAAAAAHPITFGWRATCTDPCAPPCPPTPCCDPWIDDGEAYIAAPCPAATRILGDTAFYIDIDKYNMYDETSEETANSSSMFNRAGGGSVKSAFAKVSLTADFGSRIIDPDQQGFQNVQQFEPPLERIRKLKFRIRYHDGRLVDFQGAPFDLTLVFIQLRDEIERKYHVRIPPLYK